MIHTQSTIKARYVETDKMGFIHHQNYVAYFEQARIEMLGKIGIPYRTLEDEGYFLPVLEVNVRYHQSNTFDDELIVHCFIEKMPKVKIQIRYEIYRREILTTTGCSLHAFINAQGKAIRPPKQMLEAVGMFFKDSK